MMDETVPKDLNVLTTRTRMKVLGAMQMNLTNSANVVSNDEKRERLLIKAVGELINTERSYLKNLDIISDFFMTPLMERNIISAKEFNIIFGQIISIRQVNAELLNRLEAKNATIGKAFLELAPFLRIYSSYVKNFDGACALIIALENENKEFAVFKLNQESRPEVGTKLNALLILPVQRLPRFQLLLEEIIKHTLPDAEDYQLLKDALKQVTSVASQINDILHEHENMQKILQIQRSLTDNQPRILIPGRRFIKEGPLKKVSQNGNRSHSRIFFLFSDMLMYCKPLIADYTNPNSLMCCCVIPLKHCKIEPLFNCGHQTGSLMNLKCKDESMMLYTDNVEDGNSWIEALRSTVRQYSEFRQTLKKASTAKRVLRRDAILKNQEESLSKLSKKRKAESVELNEAEFVEGVHDVLFPMREKCNVQDCLNQKKKQRLTDGSISEQQESDDLSSNVDGKMLAAQRTAVSSIRCSDENRNSFSTKATSRDSCIML